MVHSVIDVLQDFRGTFWRDVRLW